MKRRILLVLSLASVAFSNAQIIPLGSLDTYAYLTYSLRTAGVKIYTSPGSNTSLLLNMDMTVYRTLVTPAPQAPYVTMSINFISEDLFDTDPSTIEYLADESYDVGGTYHHKTSVIREDGTVLWSEEGVQPAFSTAWDPDRRHSVVFNTQTGTVMVLRDANLHWKTYSLPGTLPCIKCEGFTSPDGIADDNISRSSLTAFPNPTNNDATISYVLPPGITQGSLVFFTVEGMEVERIAVIGSGTRTITTEDLPSATYLFCLETEQGVMGAKRLVVVK